MISYEPFYRTLYRKNITEYQLIFARRFGQYPAPHEARRDHHAENTGYPVLYFDCPVSDVIEYRRDGE